MNSETAYKVVLGLVTAELWRSETTHPRWPSDQIHGVAITVEDVCGSRQVAIDYQPLSNNAVESDINLKRIETELVQSAAACLRALIYNIQKYGVRQ